MLARTYAYNQERVPSGYTSTNTESRDKANAPILQAREFGFMPLQMALYDIPSGVNNLQCIDESM